MVDLRTRKREMIGDPMKHPERLGLEGISCVSQFSISDIVGMSPDPVCNYTDTLSSPHNQAVHTANFSRLLISSSSFSS
jgi:hypothetical protein